MNAIMERFLLPLFVIMSILYAFNSFGNNTIELKKIFHHIGADSYLENGNLALYFSQEPLIKELRKSEKKSVGTFQYKSFFFPNVIVSPECEVMIKRINGYRHNYSIAIEKVDKAEKGIMITIGYDDTKNALMYEFFDSISLQKGVVFRLYNKELINQLHIKNNQPVLKMLHHFQPRIAIDPGHGGSDSGAVAYDGMVKEKDVCLAIGTTVAELLQQSGCSVLLTRTNDVDTLLDQRTFYANEHHVDLFVSIHANYSRNAQAMGIETFCIQPQLFTGGASYLSHQEKENVFYAMKSKRDYSCQLAQSIQSHVCQLAAYTNKDIVDRKVKFSVAQVLLGTQMPSVLVEVGFLSNPYEAQLLKSKNYQQKIAQGIVNGILAIIS